MAESLSPRMSLEESLLRTPPGQVVDFVRGMQNADKVLEMIQPDVLFIPERGAVPIDWSLQRFEERRGSARFRVYLPIGSHMGRNPKRQRRNLSTFTKLEKRMIVEAMWGVNREQFYPGGVKTPVLIDEVKSGGSIVSVADSILRVLKADGFEGELKVIAVEDSRARLKRVEAYNCILDGCRDDIRIITQQAPLFTIDNEYLLNTLWLPRETTSNTRFLPVTIHNTEAQEL